jgi:hypothetical protein
VTASTGRGTRRQATRPAAVRHLRITAAQLDRAVRYADRLTDQQLTELAAAADRLRDALDTTRGRNTL